MGKRHFVMLAHPYVPGKHGVAGMLASEKLDGVRAVWDGGVTRGMPATEVPFANVERDARYVAPPRATGLWSRYGKVIQAPDWWLDGLPPHCLDGELWAGRGSFNELASTIKCLVPGPGWDRVRYHVFDAPPPHVLFMDGFVDTPPNFVKRLRGATSWYAARARSEHPRHGSFEECYHWLRSHCPESRHLVVHRQEMLPHSTPAALARLEELLAEVTVGRGEGLMLRRPSSSWQPERVYDLLKVKKCQDAEAVVVGYVWGRETDRGSRHLGRMGSLRCRTDSGVLFEMSGFTDDERVMTASQPGYVTIDEQMGLVMEEGAAHAGEVVAPGFHNPQFPVGCRVTFTFRELNPSGAPKEGRYWRRRSD